MIFGTHPNEGSTVRRQVLLGPTCAVDVALAVVVDIGGGDTRDDVVPSTPALRVDALCGCHSC